MLKLVYHNTVFGPIDLEYERAVVRVGSSEDNDLVLRHSSVQSHHCVLVFNDEKLLCLPPEWQVSAAAELGTLPGPRFGLGERFTVGELEFTLAYSARSIAIPQGQSENWNAGVPEGSVAAEAGRKEAAAAFYCPNCRIALEETEVKRVGLIGRAKRCLCPRCSREVETSDA